MPGKFYNDNVRLSKAFAEGQRAGKGGALQATNPHPDPSPAKDAWDAGWTDGDTPSCAVFAGADPCSSNTDNQPTAAVDMALNKTTVPITGTGTNTITVTLTQGGVAMASKVVNAVSSLPGVATIPATVTTNASGVASFTVTGVVAGTTTLTFSYGGIIKTATCTVT